MGSNPLDLVLFDGVRSADPPIILGICLFSISKESWLAFRVEILSILAFILLNSFLDFSNMFGDTSFLIVELNNVLFLDLFSLDFHEL